MKIFWKHLISAGSRAVNSLRKYIAEVYEYAHEVKIVFMQFKNRKKNTEVQKKEIEELKDGISDLQARIRLLEREVENLKNIILRDDKKDYVKGLII
jgi:chromosome segregation ATPase